MAVPHVAGVAAVRLGDRPGDRPEDVKRAILDAATEGMLSSPLMLPQVGRLGAQGGRGVPGVAADRCACPDARRHPTGSSTRALTWHTRARDVDGSTATPHFRSDPSSCTGQERRILHPGYALSQNIAVGRQCLDPLQHGRGAGRSVSG